MKFIAKLRVWGNWGIGENVLKVFLRFRGSANRRVDLFLPLIASISGWRQCDASKCEMSRLGRVPPSAGRDVIDRKACFLSVPAQATVLASIRDPACHLETFGQSNGEVRRPSPNESRTAGSEGPRRTSPQGREVAVIEKRQNEGHGSKTPVFG